MVGVPGLVGFPGLVGVPGLFGVPWSVGVPGLVPHAWQVGGHAGGEAWHSCLMLVLLQRQFCGYG